MGVLTDDPEPQKSIVQQMLEEREWYAWEKEMIEFGHEEWLRKRERD